MVLSPPGQGEAAVIIREQLLMAAPGTDMDTMDMPASSTTDKRRLGPTKPKKKSSKAKPASQ